MTTLTLAVILQASTLAAQGETYAQARRETTESGRPLVVLVGADWCPACQTMKRTVMPQLRKKGVLRRVAFAVVNLDREKALARQLTGGGPIPQMVMFRETDSGWKRRTLVGGQSTPKVVSFIETGLKLDAEEKASQAAK